MPIPPLFRCCAVLAALIAAPGIDAAERPNVVLIMTDNHGAWTLGCYGNSDIRTPNIDKLADEGTLFDNAFASNPVCSPTRASTLTGLLPSQHGVHCFLRGGRLQTGPDARNTLDEFTSLPEVFQREGYRCGLVGKWHLGANASPQEGMTDYWITMPHGGTSTFYDATIIENGQQRKEPEYLTDFWTKHAVKFIDDDNDKPFFLFLAYNGPYSLSRLLLREGQNRHAEFYRGQELPSFPREKPHPWQLHNRDYQNNPVSIQRVATEVSGVDDGVGAVMQALQANGLDDNTIVIFMADQGWVGGHGGLFGMGDHTRPTTAVDGMMKIPMIWRHPGKIAAGHRSRKLVANYDIYDSLLEQVGIKADKADTEPVSPGNSFVAELRPQAAANTVSDAQPSDSKNEDAIFYEFETLRTVRTASWKYTHRHPNGPHELFNLKNDPQEFNNLVSDEEHSAVRDTLKQRLDAFFTKYASPKYDLYNGGGSQTVIYDGEEEEIAQAERVQPPALPDDFVTKEFVLPGGFRSQLVAGPPLVSHPTMGCFDDTGRLFVCDGAGANMSAAELEENLPNEIRMLEDQDGDGVFDKSTVFADKMTFPMGGTWHDGALYVASPPNIWRLEDTTGDGRADKRDILVDKFGYTGNAASIHGCFSHPSGRIYWCDGYHGHEFKDKDGNVTSSRKGSYIFSCWPDGSDVQIHCGGGMDNPVEVDFTDEGDIIGTVNIMYTRPRIDCLVHWQYGGAYPHREAVLDELKVTGDVLGPIHKFGHVAISGTTRYRSGVMNHQWGDNFFATEFNLGKVVRVELERSGSTYSCTEREFLSCNNRDFHPTDVIEDADGSLLVVDTGGWFYRGCPTSQIARPDVKGGLYRIVRDGMTTQVDPRGNRIDWAERSASKLMQDLKDTRYAVREKAIQECVRRGDVVVPMLASTVRNGDILARQNAVWALTRLLGQPQAPAKQTAGEAIVAALSDRDALIRQTAWHATGSVRLFIPGGEQPTGEQHTLHNKWRAAAMDALSQEKDSAVRREAWAAFAKHRSFDGLDLKFMNFAFREMTSADWESTDRDGRHALLFAAMMHSKALKHQTIPKGQPHSALATNPYGDEILTVLDQVMTSLPVDMLEASIKSGNARLVSTAARIARRDVNAGRLQVDDVQPLNVVAASRLQSTLQSDHPLDQIPLLASLIATFGSSAEVGQVVATTLSTDAPPTDSFLALLKALASQKANSLTLTPQLQQRLQTLMQTTDESEKLRLTLHAIHVFGVTEFRDSLLRLVHSNQPAAIRMDALRTLASDSKAMPPAERVALLTKLITNGTIEEQNTAAQLLGSSSVTVEQRQQIAPLLKDAGPQQLNDLLSLFSGRLTPEQAVTFLDNIENARSLSSVPALMISEIVKSFPEDLHDRANSLLDKMQAAEQAKLLKLDAAIGQLKSGNAARGREVFFSEKAKCATCHVVGTNDSGELLGKRVGPDLTTIGANRAPKDLLESILFPSSTIVRQYEPYTLVTNDGRSFSGLVIKDTADEIGIQQSTGDPVTVARTDVDELVPATVSIMPKGLDETLTPQQIADMVAWLQTLR